MTKTEDMKNFVYFFLVRIKGIFLTKGEQRDKVKRSSNFYGLRLSRPKLARTYVARNFIMLNNILVSLLPFAALVSSDQRL